MFSLTWPLSNLAIHNLVASPHPNEVKKLHCWVIGLWYQPVPGSFVWPSGPSTAWETTAVSLYLTKITFLFTPMHNIWLYNILLLFFFNTNAVISHSFQLQSLIHLTDFAMKIICMNLAKFFFYKRLGLLKSNKIVAVSKYDFWSPASIVAVQCLNQLSYLLIGKVFIWSVAYVTVLLKRYYF